MADDFAATLSTYKVQLAQVEAALTSSPDNDELLKLKQDLLEVIQLTVDLQTAETEKNKPEPSVPVSANDTSGRRWVPGDKCLAKKSDDGKYYEAVVEDILPESETVAVKFIELEKSDLCQISSLRPLLTDSTKAAAGTSQNHLKSKAAMKKELQIKQREYRRKRNLKKKMRVKEKEAESEISKNKWMDFNKKTFSKTSKGRVKKSIFASPEGGGKVGVGTCGIADKQMTKYEHGAKYNARHLIPR